MRKQLIIMKINICIVCGAEFEPTHKAVQCCSETCSNIHKRHIAENRNKENARKRSEMLIETGTENIDYVIDKWNGLATKRIYGVWFKNMHPDKTLNDYKSEFPDALLTCSKDKSATAKNSGKHMKEEKYKQMFSEKMKGENNINHKSKTTYIERQSRSPFSKEFNGYKEAENKEQMVSDFAKNALKNRISTTNKEYWIRKCDTLEEAEKLYKERQRTFTLEKCIKKYGEEEGTKVWKERQEKWKISIDKNFMKYGDGRSPSSEFADDLIGKITTSLNIEKPKKEKWIYDKNTNRAYSYDFCYKDKIIEFNGDYWHCSPKTYAPDYFNKRLNMTAKEKWEIDDNKRKTADLHNYQVLTVWESDYKEKPEQTLQECLDFLQR